MSPTTEPGFHDGVPGKGQGDTVTPVNVSTGKPGRAIQVGGLPDEMVMTPDGRTLYVMLDGDWGSGEIIPVGLPGGDAGKPLVFSGGAQDIALSPDGQVLYVSANDGASALPVVIPVSTETGRRGAPIRLPYDPDGFAATPDGRTLYTAFGNAEATPAAPDEIIPFSLRTGQAGAPVRLALQPGSVSVSPDGRTIYVLAGTSEGPGEPGSPYALIMISAESGKVIRSVALDSGPVALAVAPTGKTVYVQAGNSVIGFDAATGQEEHRYAIAPAGSDSSVPGYDATSLVISPDGHTLYASNGSQVAVVPLVS